jgi:tRNA threonylcarbamoyladenosine biosynthesis protein TsaB
MIEPILLYIDTSTSYCSAAISRGDHFIYQTSFVPGLKSAEHLHILFSECIEAASISEHELSGVVISLGPGSYTGLRIGISSAKGICMALNIPLLGISSLIQIASNCAETYPKHTYISMIDARRDEVYCAIYNSQFEELSPPKAIIVDSDWVTKIMSQYPNAVFCGNGANKVISYLKSETNNVYSKPSPAGAMMPHALQKFNLKQFENTFFCQPIYLKSPNITVSKKNIFN